MITREKPRLIKCGWKHIADFPEIETREQFADQFRRVMGSDYWFVESIYETEVFHHSMLCFSIMNDDLVCFMKKARNPSITNGILMLAQMEPNEFRKLQILSIAHHELKEMCRKEIKEQSSDPQEPERKERIKAMLLGSRKARTPKRVILYTSVGGTREEIAWTKVMLGQIDEQEWRAIYEQGMGAM